MKSISKIIAELLAHVEPDSHTREGLQDTPARVEKAMGHWFCGYKKDPSEILKTFTDGVPNNQVVCVRNIPFWSHCEHHMAPFFGYVTIAYKPNGRIVGLSKLVRLVECFAKRLQVQERLTDQIGNAILEHLNAKDVLVYVVARHSCMESRGVCSHGQETVTKFATGEIDEARYIK